MTRTPERPSRAGGRPGMRGAPVHPASPAPDRGSGSPAACSLPRLGQPALAAPVRLHRLVALLRLAAAEVELAYVLVRLEPRGIAVEDDAAALHDVAEVRDRQCHVR